MFTGRSRSRKRKPLPGAISLARVEVVPRQILFEDPISEKGLNVNHFVLRLSVETLFFRNAWRKRQLKFPNSRTDISPVCPYRKRKIIETVTGKTSTRVNRDHRPAHGIAPCAGLWSLLRNGRYHVCGDDVQR
ncbi:hypothetical protein EVAR_34524_1 [Eumeta japonica]|uniref:Uncharacterized protein n=1 Tax=Eumeta variegata TaxID=151549 RepID=A0A4C1Z5C5_EUMVA|nr:hypothetical protein EVAR_34524_1 [Eumeta japonica]